MTFKHNDFGSSPVMRSFEKVAIQKGLIKPLEIKEIVKQASLNRKSEKTRQPSGNLTIDILKLCDGLKEIGLSSYATDLENNFIIYKQSQSLYDISGESGEDLVDSAHPKGSHQLEGVPGDSVIETILDQHLKDLEMVNKKPSGKLSNASDIFKAVKFVLAQQTSEEQSKQNTGTLGMLKGYILDVAALFRSAIKQVDIGWFDRQRLNMNINQISEWSKNPSDANIREVQNTAKWLYGSIKNILEDNQDAWLSVSGQLNRVWATIGLAKKLREELNNSSNRPEINSSPPQPTVTNTVEENKTNTISKDGLIAKLNSLKNKIEYYNGLVDLRVPKNLQADPKKYLDIWDANCSKLIKYISSTPDEEISANNQSLSGKIAELNGWVNDLGKQWLKE